MTVALITLFTVTYILISCGGGGGGGGGGGIPVTMNLAATVRTPSQIDLLWTAHPGSVTGYDLDRNGSAAWPYHLSGTSFSDGNLDPATRYCYIVYAVVWPLGSVGRSNEVCVSTFATANWNIAVVDSFAGEYVSLALDPGNRAHISYRSAAGVAYATNASGSWKISIIDSAAGRWGKTSIAVDTEGAVHVSYYDYTNGRLTYATNASGTWVTSVVDGAGGWTNALALDAAGKVHISYVSGSSPYVLMYATNSSGSWVTRFLSAGIIAGTSIAVDSADAVHIGYAHGDYTCDIGYITNKAGSWTTAMVAYPAQCGVAVAVDSAGKAYIGYTTGAPSFDLRYAADASGAWGSLAVDYFDWFPGTDLSIAVNAHDRLHLSYMDHNNDLKYATNASGAWVTSYVDGKGLVGLYNSLKVDQARRAHIAYYDATNAQLKYATSP